MTATNRPTGLDLLVEVADTLETVCDACEDADDGRRLAALASRVRAYLAVARSTTPLGMPLIESESNRLTEDKVVRAEHGSHIRIVETD